MYQRFLRLQLYYKRSSRDASVIAKYPRVHIDQNVNWECRIKKYEFVERLFLLLVQLLVKNIISSFITENVIWELWSFSKAQNSCSPNLNVCPDLFRAMGRWRKLNHQIHVSCNHYNHGRIPEYLRSLDLCLVTTSLLID